jgi:ABC-type maltose transport system permease subunit
VVMITLLVVIVASIYKFSRLRSTRRSHTIKGGA